MRILDSLLREKRLRRTQRLQELAEARMCCERSAHILATTQYSHQEARTLLWQAMSPSDGLCVQRLWLAKTRENDTAKAVDEAARIHEADRKRLDELTLQLARIDKDIEKLEERREQVLQTAASDRLKEEWGQMDAWILSQRGGTT